jgi:hypothetical protein
LIGWGGAFSAPCIFDFLIPFLGAAIKPLGGQWRRHLQTEMMDLLSARGRSSEDVANEKLWLAANCAMQLGSDLAYDRLTASDLEPIRKNPWSRCEDREAAPGQFIPTSPPY